MIYFNVSDNENSTYHNYSIMYCIHLSLLYLYFNMKQATCASVTRFLINSQFKIKTTTETEREIITHVASLTFIIDLFQRWNLSSNLLRNSGIVSAFPPQEPSFSFGSCPRKKSLLRSYFLLAQAPSRCLTST